MAIHMNSVWDFTSVVKLRPSRSSGGSNLHPVWAKSSSQKRNCVDPSVALFLSQRTPTKHAKWRTVPSAADSNKATTEPSTTDSTTAETSVPNDQLPPSIVQAKVNGRQETSPQTQKPIQKRAPLTAREKLRAARVLSRYTESKPSKPGLGTKVLEAMREGDKGKKRSGLPEAPTNLFDDSKRGMPKKGLTFNFPGGSDLFLIAFSVVFISTVMFGTTYIVWKVGAIHFNEY